MGHVLDVPHQGAQRRVEVARRRRRGPFQRMQRDERLQVAVPRPGEPERGALRGAGVPVIDDDQGSRRAGRRGRVGAEAEAVEQPWVGGLRILAPDDHRARPVPDLAQRGGGRAPERKRRGARPRTGRGLGHDQGPQPVGQRDGRPGVLHRGPLEAIEHGAARVAQQLGGAGERRLDLDRLAVDQRARRISRPVNALGEPSSAQGARRLQSHGVARAIQRDVIAQQAATRARDRADPGLSHRPAPRRGGRTADERRARRARTRRRSVRPACTRGHRS